VEILARPICIDDIDPGSFFQRLDDTFLNDRFLKAAIAVDDERIDRGQAGRPDSKNSA
jgi:hypothetical protein